MTKHPRTVLLALAVLTLIVFLAAPWIGMLRVTPEDVLGHGDTTAAMVFWKLRVPRVCLAMVAGAVLSLAGMAFQAMFRNPLATPFTLGIASGASLGASAFLLIGAASGPLAVAGLTAAGFAGAMLSVAIVWGLARLRGLDDVSLLLAGVAVSFSFSSLILLMQYMADFTRAARILRWVMGGLESGVGYGDLLLLGPIGVVGVVAMLFCSRELNLITLGDDIAMSRGLEASRWKLGMFVAVSLVVGAVVAVCGPIGFVGLIVPHIGRMLIGSDHRHLTPFVAMGGAVMLTVCDTIGRTAVAPAELPVGIITALLGGPFFLWLLLSKR